MPGADNLEEEVGALVSQGKISYLVDSQNFRRLIEIEFFQQRMVCLGGREMIDHIHGSGKEGADPGLGGGIGDAFCQEAFAQAGISYEDMSFFCWMKTRSMRCNMRAFCFILDVWKWKSN